MTKKTIARQNREKAKREHSEIIRKQITGELPLPEPRDPLAGLSPAARQAKIEWMMGPAPTPPMQRVMPKELTVEERRWLIQDEGIYTAASADMSDLGQRTDLLCACDNMRIPYLRRQLTPEQAASLDKMNPELRWKVYSAHANPLRHTPNLVTGTPLGNMMEMIKKEKDLDIDPSPEDADGLEEEIDEEPDDIEDTDKEE